MRRIGRLIHFFARFAAAGRKFGYVFLNTGGVKNGDPAVAVYVGKLLLQVGKADKVDRRLLDQRRVSVASSMVTSPSPSTSPNTGPL